MGRMQLVAAATLTAALIGTAGCASMQDKMGRSGDMEAMGMSEGMQMSDADKKMMASCMAMSRDQMMKNAKCQAMAKMHPEMMNKGMNNPM